MKKGSLSLSVNAIVIFVLAFAMLGFGLFVINMLQGQIGEKVPGIFDTDAWNPPPSSQSPIEFKGSLVFQKGKTKTIGIGFYNDDPSSKEVIPASYMDCGLDGESNSDDDNAIKMTGRSQTIESSEWKPFEVKVEVGKGVEKDTYICNINMVKADNSGNPTTEVLATKQVSVVVSG